MSGLWQAMGSAYWNIEPSGPAAALAMRPGPVTPVPAAEVLALGAIGSVPSTYGIVVGGPIPYTAQALAVRDRNREQRLELDPEVKCYLPGVPRANYMHLPFQILQNESQFFVAYEYAGAVRDVLFDDPGPPQVDTWMGQSVGAWEGDTLVVTVTGFNGMTWLDRAGNHHGSRLTVTERWTMTSPDHISYEAVLDDPDTYTEPWTMRFTLYRNLDPQARLGQFKCAEFVEELLYGHLRKEPLPR